MMETICKWVDAKTTLVIFSFCFLIRSLIRFYNWWKNSLKTEKTREVKEENQQKSLRENSALEIMVKSVLISAMLLPWLVGQTYLLCEKAVIESPILAINLIKVILKSVLLPIIEKFITPLSKIFYDSTKILLQKTQFLVFKVAKIFLLQLEKLFFIGLDILKTTCTNAKIFNSTICVPTIQFVQRALVVTYSNIKKIANICTITLIPLLSTIGKIFLQMFVNILYETVNRISILYKKGKQIFILLYKKILLPLYTVSSRFVLKSGQFLSFLFSAGQVLTLKFYRTILVPLPKMIKTMFENFLKHSLQAAMKMFDWLFCLVSKINLLMLNIYLHLCAPVCKCISNNVFKPTVEAMYLITNTLIKIVKIIIIPAIPPIVVFLQSVLYKCWHHYHACYALITGLFTKFCGNVCSVMSVVTDWYWRVMSPVILETCYAMWNMMCFISNLVLTLVRVMSPVIMEMCYAMWNMVCFISNLALTLGTQAQFVVIQSLNFIAEMYVQIYNNATVLIYDFFGN